MLPPILVAFWLVVGAIALHALFSSPNYVLGYDFGTYRAAATRWLAGGFFYYPEQLRGPYTVELGQVLYPPVGLILFVPFTLLPAVLWWLVPLGIIAWRVVEQRPSPWGWVAMAALACWPYSLEVAFAGNPTIWIAALLALATRWPWVSAFILVKPSLFPFAFAGVRTRSWWLALALFLLVSVLFLPMWFDWGKVVLDARGQFSGVLYSVRDLTWMLIPTVAWLTRRR